MSEAVTEVDGDKQENIIDMFDDLRNDILDNSIGNRIRENEIIESYEKTIESLKQQLEARDKEIVDLSNKSMGKSTKVQECKSLLEQREELIKELKSIELQIHMSNIADGHSKIGKPKVTRGSKVGRPSVVDVETIMAYKNKGYNNSQIARELNISRSTICFKLRKSK